MNSVRCSLVMDRRSIYFVIGFALAGSGLYALILSLVGVRLNYLVWMDAGGPLFGLLGRLFLMMSGAVIIVLGVTNWDRERMLIQRYREEQAQAGRVGQN